MKYLTLYGRALASFVVAGVLGACSFSSPPTDENPGRPDGGGGDLAVLPLAKVMIRSVTPAKAPSSGGTRLLVTGEGFDNGLVFAIDNLPTSVVRLSSTELAVIVPPRPGAFGKVALRVTNPSGDEDVTGSLFSYYADRLRLAPRLDYAVGSQPSALVLGDVDADGNLDLVVSNQGSANLNVYLGSGFGAFRVHPERPTYDTSAQPVSLRMADINGDSRPDLLVGCVGEGMINVLLGQSGGLFAAGTSLLGRGPVAALSTGDFGARGILDLVTADLGSHTVSLYANDGHGAFGAPISYLAGPAPARLAVGDLNGDTHADVVVTRGGSDSATVFLGTGLQATPLVDSGTYAVHSAPRWVELGDFNGDRLLDVVVSNSASNDLSVLLGTGGGRLAPRVDYPAGQGPEQIALSDLNGDGALDLVVANAGSSNITVLLGNGDGTFPRRLDFPANTAPVAVVVGRLNDDQKPDLAVANLLSGNVSVYLNLSE